MPGAGNGAVMGTRTRARQASNETGSAASIDIMTEVKRLKRTLSLSEGQVCDLWVMDPSSVDFQSSVQSTTPFDCM